MKLNQRPNMVAFPGGNVSQIRNVVLSAVIVVVLFVLLRTYNVGPRNIQETTRQSIQVISSSIASGSWHAGHPPRITKVTSLFGSQHNDLYDAAIKSHEEHDRINGYGMEILREKILDRRLSQPAYLLSVMMAELAKPEDERTEWLVWFGPDVLILNPQIPLELFLPPEDFPEIFFLGTHDKEGFGDGAFFLRVHKWSAKMLVETIAMSRAYPEDKKAFEKVLKSDGFREGVIYQPRTWYNAYQTGPDEFEGGPGSLLVHFHTLSGDKWKAMSNTIAEQKTPSGESRWNLPLKQTSYEKETQAFWLRLRQSWHLLNLAFSRNQDDSAQEAVRRLQYAATYEMDDAGVLMSAMQQLQDQLNLPNDEKIL